MFEYIQDAHLQFTSAPTNRTATKGIVLHHRAGFGDVVSEHNDSLARGWIGIGYNLYVRQDGSIWYGRGLDAKGAHAGRTVKSSPNYAAAATNNSETIGIGFEGYYQSGSTLSGAMPKAQYDAGVKLIRDLLIAYPTVMFIKGHKEMPAVNTLCPGNAFPLTDMVKAAYAQDIPASTGGYAVKRYLYLTSPRFQGEDVSWLQTQLNANGASPALKVDCDYGSKTDMAVRVFQKNKGLTVDGIVGKNTVIALDGTWAKQ